MEAGNGIKYSTRSATYAHRLHYEHFPGTLRYYLSRTGRLPGQIYVKFER